MASGGITSALRAIEQTIVHGSLAVPQGPDLGFEPKFHDEVAPLLEFLWSRYFRVELIGVHNIPDKGPGLLVCNHSGGLPYDGMMLMYGVRRDHPTHRAVRAMVANFAFRSRVMAPVVARYGGVRASMENGNKLLQDGQLVAVFPEGLRGVGKLYRERYRLTRFGRGGFVRLARMNRVPIVPVAVVGAEEIHPMVGRLTTLARPLGLPFIPITPTFPLLGPLGLLPLPTKWAIQVGTPIEVPPDMPDDDATTLELAEKVRGRVDAMIADLLLARRSIFFG